MLLGVFITFSYPLNLNNLTQNSSNSNPSRLSINLKSHLFIKSIFSFSDFILLFRISSSFCNFSFSFFKVLFLFDNMSNVLSSPFIALLIMSSCSVICSNLFFLSSNFIISTRILFLFLIS
jgi:hypothetical protein